MTTEPYTHGGQFTNGLHSSSQILIKTQLRKEIQLMQVFFFCELFNIHEQWQKSMACTLDSGSVRCQAVELVCDRWKAVEVVCDRWQAVEVVCAR